jgi:hypothetical protein
LGTLISSQPWSQGHFEDEEHRCILERVRIVAEPRRELKELLRERTDLLGDVLDAIGKDIADITTDERLFEKHRKRLEAIAKIGEVLIVLEKSAMRGPLV